MGGKVRRNVSIVGESWFVAVSPGRRMSQEQLLLSYFYQLRPAHTGFLLSTETTTSLSLAAIALHLLEVGQHEREGLVLIGATWREKAMVMVGQSLWT